MKLARAGAVRGVKEEGGEIELRVTSRKQLALEVVLYPDEPDWSCECDGSCSRREDACDVVAAAAIAVKQAREQGSALPGEEGRAPAHVGYRLDGRTGTLGLTRTIVQGEKEVPVPGGLAKWIKGERPSHVPRFSATKTDLALEAKLGGFKGGDIPPGLIKPIFSLLTEVEDLRIDGMPAVIEAPSPGLRLRVKEHEDGFLARLDQDPNVNEVYRNGVLRRGNALSRIAKHGLSDRLFDSLRKGRVFRGKSVGGLVGELLPVARKRRIVVLVETENLPGSTRVRPRLELATARVDGQLEVLPTLVYGDPARARVDGDRLTLLSGDEVPVRNTRLEQALISRLSDTLGLEVGERTLLDAAAAVRFAQRVQRLDQDKVSVRGEDLASYRELGDLVPHLVMGDDGSFELWFAPTEEAGDRPGAAPGGGVVGISAGEGSGPPRGAIRADAAAVLRAWRDGDDLAPLLGGGFGRLPEEFMAQHGHLVADLLAARDEEGKTHRGALVQLAALAQALDQPPPPGFDRLRALVGEFDGIPSAPLPDDLQAELRGYQREGVDWLAFLRRAELGALLADDMGLGKTLQALCAVQGRTLVVAPTSVLQNWATEAARFRPGLKVCVYHGTRRELDEEADLIVTSYALLRLDLERLQSIEWDTVVLDEAQAIKNPGSQVARAAYRLEAKWRLAMTGTPVENRVEELWSQLHFLNRGLLGGRSDFQERYARPVAAGDQAALERLRRRVRPFVLRRLKREVAKELPPRTDVVLRCELGREEQAVYDAVRAATQQEVVSRLGKKQSVIAILEALLRLRQAACHSALVPGQEGRFDGPSAKLRLLMETLDEALAEGHKALIFSQWTSLLDRVEPVLKERGVSFVRLDGSTRDRGAVVEKFQSDDGPPVMLISLRAGGTGLNLTAADHVFLLDPWWNPAVEDQAADRAHRIGQDRPVIVHRLVAEGTVEDRILELQARKRAVAEAAVGQGAAGEAITREELLALLG